MDEESDVPKLPKWVRLILRKTNENEKGETHEARKHQEE